MLPLVEIHFFPFCISNELLVIIYIFLSKWRQKWSFVKMRWQISSVISPCSGRNIPVSLFFRYSRSIRNKTNNNANINSNYNNTKGLLLSQCKFQLTASSHFRTFSVRFFTSLKKRKRFSHFFIGCTRLLISTVLLLQVTDGEKNCSLITSIQWYTVLITTLYNSLLCLNKVNNRINIYLSRAEFCSAIWRKKMKFDHHNILWLCGRKPFRT